MSITPKIWFTSDNHFSHNNIIKYCKRPFLGSDGLPDVHYMNRTMTERWNSVVAPFDQVYHLGDFCFGAPFKIKDLRSKLNGKITLIRGNHDRSIEIMKEAGFEEVYNRLEIEIAGRKIYLAHIPLLPNQGPAPEGKVRKYKAEFIQKPPVYYDYWLCGHVHEHWKRKGRIINVGVDQWDFYPVSLLQLITSEDEDEVLQDPDYGF